MAVSATHVHKHRRICLCAIICHLRCVLILNINHIQPGQEQGKLGLHEAVECTALDWVGFEPLVVVFIGAVLADLEGCEGGFGMMAG